MYAHDSGDGDRGFSQGAPRSGSREGHGARAERPARRDEGRATSRAPRDPLFDQPYEAPALVEAAALPSWEATARPGVRSISANIKPKRRVAALFKSA
jgi:hypothetical protein